MSTPGDAGISPREIDEHVAYIAAAVGELSRNDSDVARFAEVAERLGLLRSQYRANPRSLNGHLSRLRELSQQFEALLDSRLSRVVDRYHEVTEHIRRANREREFWREYLIRKAPPAGRANLSGTTADVVIRSSQSRLLPAAGTEPRAQLERLIQETGRWQEVSQLSRTKIQRALEEARFSAAQRQAIAELCPLTVVHQVSSRVRTT